MRLPLWKPNVTMLDSLGIFFFAYIYTGSDSTVIAIPSWSILYLVLSRTWSCLPTHQFHDLFVPRHTCSFMLRHDSFAHLSKAFCSTVLQVGKINNCSYLVHSLLWPHLIKQPAWGALEASHSPGLVQNRIVQEGFYAQVNRTVL